MRVRMQINENNQSMYCYEGTSVLINKKNIKDHDVLEEVEKLVVTYKLAQIINNESYFKRYL